MEGFVKFLLNIAHKHEHSLERLHPVYALDQTLPIPEHEHLEWEGYHSSKPVRSNNQAAEHVQNDVYGEMILTLAPIFLDERFHHLRTKDHEALIAHLAQFCSKKISEPDAGLWELRNGWQEHSFSNLMCWAGLDRAQRIQSRGYLQNVGVDLAAERARAEAALGSAILEGSLRNGPKDASFDAALLQLPILRYPNAEIGKATVDKIVHELSLKEPGYLYRYKRNDDFGMPQSAFVICSFWLVQAYASLGNVSAAAQAMKHACKASNTLGLFSEHYLPESEEQCGNFPQAYSHVGLINAAFSISPPWEHFL
jgi:GH15 family glucan-1,4-alpha-glucosidase